MSRPTVHAVMKCTIEIPVRASNSGETLEELFRVSKMEAEGILRNMLVGKARVVSDIEFSYATIRVTT